MRTALRAALVVLALAVSQAPSAAETVQGTARVGNRTIALPPGTWTKVTEDVTPRGWQFGGAPQNLMNLSVAYIRTGGGRVTGIVTVVLSRDGSPEGHGYTLDRKCSRNDFFFLAAPANYARDQDCTYATHVVPVMPQDLQSFQARVLTEARRAGRVSPTYLAVTTRRADAMHILMVEYWFAPEPAGFPASAAAWSASPWHVTNLDGPRRAYMERMKAWAERAQEETRRSFRNRPVTPLPEP